MIYEPDQRGRLFDTELIASRAPESKSFLITFEDVEAFRACKAGDLAVHYYVVDDIISYMPVTRSPRAKGSTVCYMASVQVPIWSSASIDAIP
jgi:hypothetical protein